MTEKNMARVSLAAELWTAAPEPSSLPDGLIRLRRLVPDLQARRDWIKRNACHPSEADLRTTAAHHGQAATPADFRAIMAWLDAI